MLHKQNAFASIWFIHKYKAEPMVYMGKYGKIQDNARHTTMDRSQHVSYNAAIPKIKTKIHMKKHL